MKRQPRGFTLIELMIVVVVIAILSAIALPSYNAYVIRARLTEAFSALASAQAAAENFWSNSRTYSGFNTSSAFPPATANFTYGLSNQTQSAYTITATGASKALTGFVFTIDQNGNKATTGVPAGWATSTSCWVNKPGGVCVQ